MTLELKEFDMKSIQFKPNENKGLILIGKRETGISFLVRDLLYCQKDITIGTVISKTEELNTLIQ